MLRHRLWCVQSFYSCPILRQCPGWEVVISISQEFSGAETPARSNGTLDPPVEGPGRLTCSSSPASWFLEPQPNNVSGALSAGWEDLRGMGRKNHLGSSGRKYLGSAQHLGQRRISCQCPPLSHSTYLAGHSLWSLLQRLACYHWYMSPLQVRSLQ